MEGNAEGGLREIAHEFGGWIPHGGDNRDSDGIGMGLVVSIVLFFFVAHCLVREAIELLLVLLSIYSYIPCRTQGPTAPKQCHDFYLQRKLKIICGADYWCHKSFYLRCK